MGKVFPSISTKTHPNVVVALGGILTCLCLLQLVEEGEGALHQTVVAHRGLTWARIFRAEKFC